MWKLGDTCVDQLAVAIEEEESGLSASHRVLGDELLWQFEVECLDFHPILQ
jgi:hypothetical protein